ncbi:AP-1 complex subunit mu-1 [Venturia inaequalis]|nr:AP-1 complex subunit mu-1 [Venturia inaequalis]
MQPPLPTGNAWISEASDRSTMSISTKFGACPETWKPSNWTTEAASTTSSRGSIDCPPALSALSLDFHNAGVSEA